jgi:hypothetical protein
MNSLGIKKTGAQLDLAEIIIPPSQPVRNIH